MRLAASLSQARTMAMTSYSASPQFRARSFGTIAGTSPLLFLSHRHIDTILPRAASCVDDANRIQPECSQRGSARLPSRSPSRRRLLPLLFDPHDADCDRTCDGHAEPQVPTVQKPRCAEVQNRCGRCSRMCVLGNGAPRSNRARLAAHARSTARPQPDLTHAREVTTVRRHLGLRQEPYRGPSHTPTACAGCPRPRVL